MPDASGIAAGSSAADLKSQLDEVWAALAGLGREIGDKEWHLPTPCPGWDVSAQYAHVIGTESMLLGRPNPELDPGRPPHVRNDIGGFNEVWVAALAGSSRDEVVEKLEEVTADRAKTLSAMTEEEFSAPAWTPVGQADYRRFMQIRVFDCWVHEQDIRDATGRPGHESGPVAEQSIDEIARALGFVVGKKAALPADSTVSFRLNGPVRRDLDVAVVDGRASVVPPLDAPATVTLTMSSSALSRLGCGRVTPDSVLDGSLGGVQMSGDEELGRRVVTNLAFTI